MPNLSDLWRSLGLETSGAFGKASDIIGSLAGTLADIGGAVSFISLIGELFGQTNELAGAAAKITTTIMDALASEFGAAAKLERMKEMQDSLGEARTQHKSIQTAIEEHRVDEHGNPTDPETAAAFAIALNNTSNGVEKIGGGDLHDPVAWAYWLRPFSRNAVYSYSAPSIGYSVFCDPRDNVDIPGVVKDDGLVFDYRMTLPAYLALITIRLIVLGVTKPAFLKEKWATDELDVMIGRLQAVHDKIGAAIVSLPLVPLAVINNFWVYPYGAVEEFSGFADVDVWNWGNLDPHDHTFQQRFPAIYAIRTLAHCKKVYSSVGVPALFNTVNHLRDLRGLPTAQWNPNISWSLREVERAITATTKFNQLINRGYMPDNADYIAAETACTSAIATRTTFDDAIATTTSYKPSTAGRISVRNTLGLLLKDVLPIGLFEAFNTV